MALIVLAIPCFNETERLRRNSVRQLVRDSRLDLVIVDDGSDGQNGQVTAESMGHDETPAQADSVQVGAPVDRLSTGCTVRRRHHRALLRCGAIRCWGHNFARQLGYGDRENIGDDETPETAGDVMVLDRRT
jgi:hypothetical protein